MTLFLQFLINGILAGSLYALLALAIVLIYKSTRVFNFALGEMMTMGAFILYMFMATFHLPVWLSMLLTIISCLIIGLLIERLALRPLIGQPLLAAIMATLALSLIFKGIVLFVWGSPTISYTTKILPGGATIVGDLFFSKELLYTFLISLTAFILMTIFFKFTKTGL